MKLDLCVLEDTFSVHRLSPTKEIPVQIFNSTFYSVSKSEQELSIVCSSSIQVSADQSETGWSCLKIVGPLDFSLTGILADISAVLAQAHISIFAVSTFDTDYILVKKENLQAAVIALQEAQYNFKS